MKEVLHNSKRYGPLIVQRFDREIKFQFAGLTIEFDKWDGKSVRTRYGFIVSQSGDGPLKAYKSTTFRKTMIRTAKALEILAKYIRKMAEHVDVEEEK